MKIIYNYSYKTNKAYPCEVDDNMEGITTPPPIVKENEKYIPDGDGWKVVKDYRKKTVYNISSKESRVIKDLDDSPGENETFKSFSSQDDFWNGEDWESPTSVKAERVRSIRNGLLQETDYIMLPDYPLQDKTQWENYRQQLRDITEQAGFPDNVVYPIKPE